MSQPTSESRFADRLADLTGANVSKTAAVNGAHVVVEKTAAETIAAMPFSAVIEHPSFVAGFSRRIEERMPELDEAVAGVDLGG